MAPTDLTRPHRPMPTRPGRPVVALADRLITGSCSLVASGAWLFDCLDQRLFSPGAPSTPFKSLKAPGVCAGRAVQTLRQGPSTAFFLIGWGVGGMVFGALRRSLRPALAC